MSHGILALVIWVIGIIWEIDIEFPIFAISVIGMESFWNCPIPNIFVYLFGKCWAYLYLLLTQKVILNEILSVTRKITLIQTFP